MSSAGSPNASPHASIPPVLVPTIKSKAAPMSAFASPDNRAAMTDRTTAVYKPRIPPPSKESTRKGRPVAFEDTIVTTFYKVNSGYFTPSLNALKDFNLFLMISVGGTTENSTNRFVNMLPAATFDCFGGGTGN
jgi:hypothetical protein